MPTVRKARPPRRRRPVPATTLPYWVAALACAGLAAVVVGGLASHGASATRRWGTQTTVEVAVRDLVRGHIVTAGDLVARAWPVALLPGAAARSPVGRVVTEPILGGEVVAEERLAPNGVSPVAALLPRNTRAVALPAGPAVVPLAVGDRVDVLAATGAAGAAGAGGGTGADEPARLLTADCVVVAVDAQGATIAVPERDAPAVVAATVAGVAVVALRDAFSGSSSPTG
jgi:Flp pilus assembly protein CpaB